jgi:hypothetical protein
MVIYHRQCAIDAVNKEVGLLKASKTLVLPKQNYDVPTANTFWRLRRD